jgi:sensor histidine kinase YesM
MMAEFKRLYLFVFLGLFLSATSLKAQEPLSSRITIKEGLPSNEVFDIFQDNKGFIWMATAQGLCRYDGVNFKTFSTDKPQTLSGSNIQQDENGRIWYQTFDGNVNYIDHDRVINFDFSSVSNFVPFQVSKKHLFVFAKNQIRVYSLMDYKLISTIDFPSRKIYYTATNGEQVYCIKDSILVVFDPHLNQKVLPLLKYRFGAPKGACRDNNLLVFDKYNSTQTIIVNPHDNMRKKFYAVEFTGILNDVVKIDNHYWFCTSQGVQIFKLSSGRLRRIKTLFPDKVVGKVILDHQQNIWVGTTRSGVQKISSLNSILYGHENLVPKVITYHSRDKLFVGGDKNDLYLFNQITSEFQLVDQNKNIETMRFILNDTLNQTVIINSDFTYFYDKKQKHGFNLAVKEMVQLDSFYYAYAASGNLGVLRHPAATSIKQRKSIWDDIFNNYPHEGKEVVYSYYNASIRGKSLAFNAAQQEVMVATNLGMFKLTPSGSEEQKFQNAQVLAQQIAYYNGFYYFIDLSGNVYQTDFKNKMIPLIPRGNELNEKVFKFRIYDNALYYLSENGLKKLDLSTKETYNFALSVPYYELNDVYKIDSALYVAANQGIISIVENKRVQLAYNPIVLLNSFTVNGNRFNISKTQDLKHSLNNIKIDFSVIDFRNSFSNEISYSLNGVEWNAIDKELRTLNFPALSPGEYQLYIRVTHHDTHQTKDFLLAEFNVMQPFWRTWWFYLLIITLISMAFYSYLKWQIGILRSQNKLLNEKVNLERNLNQSVLTAIRSQMNPHFFYNALNTIQSFIYSDDKIKATKYLSKFSKLTRMILDMSSKERVLLSDEIESLKIYLELEKMRFEDDFSYLLEIAPSLDVKQIKVSPLLIQPYVENALKHGLLHKKGNKQLTLRFLDQSTFLQIEVDDNGVGREKSNELNQHRDKSHQSFAVDANKKRLEILNENKKDVIALEIIDKHDDAGQSLGTLVILRIPYST